MRTNIFKSYRIIELKICHNTFFFSYDITILRLCYLYNDMIFLSIPNIINIIINAQLFT